MANRYRWIGDPAERAEGRKIAPGDWFDLPSDPVLAGKIMGNGHYEIEGILVIAADEVVAPRRRTGTLKLKTDTDDPELREESGGWKE